MERVCRKCEIDGLDKEAYMRSIQNRIDQLDEEIKTDDLIYEKRLLVCQECSYFHEGLCGACGCFVELRAAVAHNRCPYEKWY